MDKSKEITRALNREWTAQNQLQIFSGHSDEVSATKGIQMTFQQESTKKKTQDFTTITQKS